MRTGATALGTALCAVACSGTLEPRLALQDVTPAVAPAGTAVELELGGVFPVGVRVVFNGGGQSSVEGGYRVWLGDAELDAVAWLGPERLVATVPADVTAGRYDVRVQCPDGEQDSLARAFVLTAAPAVETAEVIRDDATGDGAPFAFVFAHAGRVWVGPRSDGTGAISFFPDGTDARPSSFAFARDDLGNGHRNASPSPYPSIGRAGCGPGTSTCGPDDEDGRGLFGAARLGGDDWLVIAGGRSDGDLDYVYMTRDAGSTLTFAYVDLSEGLGGATKGVSALHGLGNRLYLGLADSGARRPYLFALFEPPGAGGINVDSDSFGGCNSFDDGCELNADVMPGFGTAASPVAIIDSFADFGERLYVANADAVVRATVAAPLDASAHPEHWRQVTPSTPAYAAFASLTTTKTAELEPRDRAVPAMVPFAGRLFLARNTVAGPQLWACDPELVDGPPPASAAHCDPGDWQLWAANTAATADLSQLERAGNTRITLLAATALHLYVGFDNDADGVVVARATAAGALGGNFTGQGGCAAGAAGCEGIGGDGFGDDSNTCIFAATAVDDGTRSYLYVITGDGTSPARLVRVAD